MDGQAPHRRRSRQPRAVDPERRAALAARRRERAARGESAATRGGSASASARGATYRSTASVERQAGQVYGSRAAGAASVPPPTDRRRRPSTRADRERTRPNTSPRRRIPLWSKLTVIAGAVLALMSGTALAGMQMAIARYAGNVQQNDLLGAAAAQAEPGKELEGPLNFLLLGVDYREGWDESDVRSDTIMVLHIPSSHDQAYLFSVPRDTWVSVPGYWDMKITEAFYHGAQNADDPWAGGTQLVAATINQLTGLQFDGAAIVNFGGFKKIIDAMGGVEFCVEDPATSEHMVLVNGEPMGIGRATREGLPYEPVRYEVGCQHMAGWQALDYVRQRKNLESGRGDYGRQRNQKALLQAMARQATSTDVMTNLATLDRLLLAAGDALTIHLPPNVELIDLLWTLRNIRGDDLVALQTNAGQFNSAGIPGVSAEALTPASLDMFRAAAEDTMAEFVINNPDFISE